MVARNEGILSPSSHVRLPEDCKILTHCPTRVKYLGLTPLWVFYFNFRIYWKIKWLKNTMLIHSCISI